MPIVDLFSSRQVAANKVADVWTYDQIPSPLRVQVSNIVQGALGTTNPYARYNAVDEFELIAHTVANEHGRLTLVARTRPGAPDVVTCLLNEDNILVWLDVVELSFRVIKNSRARWGSHERNVADVTIKPDDAIEELNERFRRAGFGYRYEGGEIIRVDNDFVYQNATKPTLELLADPRFAGANDEFRSAHNHYKAGEYRDCAVDALNAMESVMKSISDAKGWHYEKGARASDLLRLLRRNGLLPEFADQSFEQLFATLKTGLPALRNDTGGHGQGTQPVDVPIYVATYALNLAASKICFLVSAFLESEK